MTISKNTSRGQGAVVIIFCLIVLGFAVGAVIAGNLNYLYMALLTPIFFSPAFIFTFMFFDVEVGSSSIVVRNFFKKIVVPISEFERIVPAQNVLTTLNSPYFTIVLNNKGRYNFIYDMPFVQRIQTNRKSIAEKLTSDVVLFINNSNAK
jgi:hypothetical protein